MAVSYQPANLLVLAGAGSGKTKVLVSRIAYLIQNHRIGPANIMAVTFTNKAAREMRERLEKMLQFPVTSMWVGTFHGLAHRFLRAHWQEAGLSQHFQIIDSEDQFRIIKRLQKDLDLAEERWPIKQTQWFINNKKDQGIRPQHIQYGAHDIFDKTLTKVYELYTEYCKRNNVVDFAELLLRTHEVLRDNLSLLEHYQDRFKHILVDEFQDTNDIQYAFVKLICGRDNFLTAVGDDDQSIYGWRGAKIENIQKLTKDFKDTITIRLEQNYRSTKNILAASNAVIEKNSNRLGKKLWTDGETGGLITLYSAMNDIDEASFIVKSILHEIHDGASRNDIAILYRSNAQSRVLEEQLIQAGLPYRIYGGMRFFDRAEIKDALAYLRLLNNENDDAALERIINVPTRGVGNVTLNKIRDLAKANNLSLWQSAKQHISGNLLAARAHNSLQNFIELIENIKTETENLAIAEQIEHVLFRASLKEFYSKDKSDRGRMRLDNLNELVSAAREFDDNNDEASMSLFLAHAALESGDDGNSGDTECVQLMTLHSAKGLEFPIVFISGLEQGLFPHQLSMSEPDKLEEERRLCYVGMTRAMQKLYLTHAQLRRLHGNEQYRRPSCFLYDLPEELLDKRSGMSLFTTSTTYSQKQPESKATIPQNTSFENNKYSIGQLVEHATFGVGTILNFEGAGDNLRIQVNFKSCGTKLLAAAYAKLNPL